jgi:phosphatidylserine/phosphatidylglycerophosphate/cardiolipin synthase-like enzyme
VIKISFPLTNSGIISKAILACLLLITAPSYAATPFHGTASFDVAFPPREDGLALILSAIHSAQKTIYVAAYGFTSKPIATALNDAHKRGVDVRVVVDGKANGKQYTAATFLRNHGIPVRFNNKYSIHHNKFMVIDEITVETGSFNFTSSAAKRNAENVLVLYNASTLAARYIAEWKELWAEAEDEIRK